MKGPVETMKFRSDLKSKFYIVPRDVNKEIEIVEVDPHFVFHYANAYEDENGVLIFDGFKCETLQIGITDSSDANTPWVQLDYSKTVPFPLLTRFTLAPSNTGKWEFFQRKLSPSCLDFPAINPTKVGKDYRYVYSSVGSDPVKSSPFQGLVMA